VIVPASALHVTDVLEDVPCIVALKESVPPVTDEALEGTTVTEVTPGFDGWICVDLPTPTHPESQIKFKARKVVSTRVRFVRIRLIVLFLYVELVF